MAKIRVVDLWQYIGYIVYLDHDVVEDAPKGTYIVVSKDDFGVTIGNYVTRATELIEEYEDDATVTLVGTAPDIETLLSFKLAQLIALIGEGWTDDVNGMCVTPYLEEYKLLNKLKG